MEGTERWIIRVTSSGAPVRSALVCLELPGPRGILSLTDGTINQPVQTDSLPDGRVRAFWVQGPLGANEVRSATLQTAVEPLKSPITVKRENGIIAVQMGDQLFTRFWATGVAKPFCFPLTLPNGLWMVRGFPIEPKEGDSTDHRHHTGFWVAYGSVNGHDLWSDHGRIVVKEIQELTGGPVFGRIKSLNEWRAPDGTVLCYEERELIFWETEDGRIIDLKMTFRSDREVVFGDTKEGFVAIRIPDSMRVDRGGGHILNANGDQDTSAWGKRAPWCLYTGSVGGQPAAIAFLDHPANVGFPNPWHVRDYGLFANGPFARKDFGLPPEPPVRVLPEKPLTLRYRLILMPSHPTPEAVQEMWNGFARPPTVELVG